MFCPTFIALLVSAILYALIRPDWRLVMLPLRIVGVGLFVLRDFVEHLDDEAYGLRLVRPKRRSTGRGFFRGDLRRPVLMVLSESFPADGTPTLSAVPWLPSEMRRLFGLTPTEPTEYTSASVKPVTLWETVWPPTAS